MREQRELKKQAAVEAAIAAAEASAAAAAAAAAATAADASAAAIAASTAACFFNSLCSLSLFLYSPYLNKKAASNSGGLSAAPALNISMAKAR